MRFALAALATWRVTHLLAREDGPGGVVARAREAIGSRPLGELMDCFGCLSIWVAAGFTPYIVRPGRRSGADPVVAWLALSGAACLLERLGDGPAPVEIASQEGEPDGMLR